MSFAAPVLAIASAVIPAIAGFSDGQYQAAIAKNNAKIAAENAKRAADRMQIEQQRADMENAAGVAAAEVAQAASGVSILSRSALQVREGVYRTGREEAKDIIEGGTLEARNLLQDSANFRAKQQQANTASIFALAEGVVKAGSAATGGSKSSGGSGYSSIIGESRSTKKRFK